MEIFVQNSSRRDYRYVFTAKCGEWSKKISANIKGSVAVVMRTTIPVDVPSFCLWSTASLEDFREAEGLEGPEPQPSKVPGIDDAELARQATVQRVVEYNPKVSILDLQRRMDEACKQPPVGELMTAPVSSLGDRMTACVKASDDLVAALRVLGEAQNRAKAEALTEPVPSRVVAIRLTGTPGLSFRGDCLVSNDAGSTSKIYEGSVPFQLTIENTDFVSCTVASNSSFGTLKLEIVKDGNVIGESDTQAPYGIVSVSRKVN